MGGQLGRQEDKMGETISKVIQRLLKKTEEISTKKAWEEWLIAFPKTDIKAFCTMLIFMFLRRYLFVLGRGLQRQAHLPIFAFYDHMDI